MKHITYVTLHDNKTSHCIQNHRSTEWVIQFYLIEARPPQSCHAAATATLSLAEYAFSLVTVNLISLKLAAKISIYSLLTVKQPEPNE